MTARRAFAESQHQHRQASSRRRRQAFVGLIAVAITTLTVVAVAMDRLLRPGAFPIKELRLEGEFIHLDPEVVRATIVEQLEGNYFSLDLKRIEKAVEAMPWAYRATVQRSWPHGVTVRIEEQRPVARWGDKNWLNEEAQIIQLEHVVETDGLIQLSGPDSTAAEVWTCYRQWAPALHNVGLELESITVDERFAWSLSVRPAESATKVQVLLGSNDQDQRVHRLTGSYAALRREPGSLRSIDLRYPNGMAVARLDAKPGHEVAISEVD